MRRFILVLIVVIFAIAIVGPIVRTHGQTPASKAPAQRPSSELEKLMQKKLKCSQKLLEGIALNDLKMVAENAQELMTLSKTAEFRVLKSPEYEVHSNEFRRSLDEMLKGVKVHNLDSVTLAYVDMTLACVRCHKHVREVRVTQADGPAERGLVE